MAANSFMRSAFAAAFPLFAGAMYTRLGTVGATALLAGLATLMAPLPCVSVPSPGPAFELILTTRLYLNRFIFHRIGPRLRADSKFAV
jgi:hypothetical protein